MKSCKALRGSHKPRAPDLRKLITKGVPSALTTKYYRALEDLFNELRLKDVRPVLLAPLGKGQR